jgi:ribosomal protein S18 acetylase RimI-like enzyme
MNSKDVTYKINQAATVDILNHLVDCKHSFNPPLDQRVNIDAYAKKIFLEADTFEAWNENKLIGLIATYYNDIEKKAYITNVSVVDDFGNRKVASKLLEMCIKYVENMQCKEISLEVHIQSEKARKLYKNYSFEEVGLNDQFLLMRRIR